MRKTPSVFVCCPHLPKGRSLYHRGHPFVYNLCAAETRSLQRSGELQKRPGTYETTKRDGYNQTSWQKTNTRDQLHTARVGWLYRWNMDGVITHEMKQKLAGPISIGSGAQNIRIFDQHIWRVFNQEIKIFIETGDGISKESLDHRLAYTHKLTRQPACTLYHNKMCPLHAVAPDKNSEAESYSHTLTYYIFLWIIEGILFMILK